MRIRYLRNSAAARFAGQEARPAAAGESKPGRRTGAWRWMARPLVVLAAMLALVSCSAVAAAKRYPMEGDVKALDAAAKTATIDAGKIGDWMEAMTMDYSVKPDSEFAKLKVGDHIKATVVVEDDKYYVTAVTVVAKH